MIDRNRITAGGVTAGIDFALRTVSEIAGAPAAQRIELFLEYDPAPPFRCGHPRIAPPELTQSIRDEIAERFSVRAEQIARITARANRA